MNNLVDCLGTVNYGYGGGLVEKVGRIIDYFKREKKVDFSRRNFLKNAGMGAAAVAIGGIGVLGNPQEAQASSLPRFIRTTRQPLNHPMPEGVAKSKHQIVKNYFKQYIRGKWHEKIEEDRALILEGNGDVNAAKQMVAAYLDDPAAFYVGILFDYRFWNGDLNLGPKTVKLPESIDWCMSAIYGFLNFFNNHPDFNKNISIKNLYRYPYTSLSYAFYGTDKNEKSIQNCIETGQEINFSIPSKDVDLKSALWATGILKETYQLLGKRNEMVEIAKLEDVFAKKVGYRVGELPHS